MLMKEVVRGKGCRLWEGMEVVGGGWGSTGSCHLIHDGRACLKVAGFQC